MNEHEIKAAIVTYGRILDRAEAVLKDIDERMERLNASYAETAALHESAGREIERLAAELENRAQATAVLAAMARRNNENKKGN